MGKELPAEREMAKMLGISRTSLRECLAILEFLGVIARPGYRKVVTKGADDVRSICTLVQTFGDMNAYDRIVVNKQLA